MSNYIYVEWLDNISADLVEALATDNAISENNKPPAEDERVQPLSNKRNGFRWCLTDGDVINPTFTVGDEEELIEYVLQQQLPIILIIPGEKVSVQRVEYSAKESRHFAKMLPYSIEDYVVGDVDKLHFTIGEKQEPYALIGYVENQWFSDIWERLSARGVIVERCIADFQCIYVPKSEDKGKQLTCWFNTSRVMVCADDGRGFSVSRSVAPFMIKSFMEEWLATDDRSMLDDGSIDSSQINTIAQSCSIDIYCDSTISDEECLQIQAMFNFPDGALINVEVYKNNKPPLSCFNPQAINFCVGDYRKKVSSANHIKEYRVLASVGILALLAFIFVNSFDIYQMRHKNVIKKSEIESVYRQVIPVGVVNDPIRQLTAKLGSKNVSTNDSSYVVLLLSAIAPVTSALDIDLSTINYNNKDKAMRVSIQVNSFSVIEQLRSQLTQAGLSAELLSSSAVDGGFQARLRIIRGVR